MKTLVIGCEMGQVGVSFTVDPQDKDGYRERLRTFLTRHNPRGLRLLDSVVDTVPEIDTFTKLFRKYKVKNYEKRLEDFFRIYGPEYTAKIPSLLRQWESREEELMRFLVLDNGPEVDDVDPNARLTAFLGAHRLARSDPRIEAILQSFPSPKDSHRKWERLVGQFGPEPDPRTYAFGPVHYPPRGSGGAGPKPPSSPTPRSSTRHDPTNDLPEEHQVVDYPSDFSPNPRRPAPTPVKDNGGLDWRGNSKKNPQKKRDATPTEERLLSLALTPKETPGEEEREMPPSWSRASPGFSYATTDRESKAKPLAPLIDQPSYIKEAEAVVPSRTTPDEGQSLESLWRRMCQLLSKRGVESWQLFYGDRENFIDLLDSLDLFVKGDRKRLIQEWQRRASEALVEEPLHTGSSYFYSAVHEAALILRIKPICLQVMGITNVRNKEHLLGFNAITAQQGSANRVERLALVGEEAALRRVMQEGAGVWSAGLSAAHPSGIVFPREPFLHWKEARTTAVLLCDVAIGKYYTEKQDGDNPSHSVLKEDYHSILYRDPISGPCLLVTQPAQVLPRLLLLCSVDPNVLPCAAHPERPVEFYVRDAGKFVCSRCAVLGEYKGHDMVSLEEAATTGRHKLGQVQKTAEDIIESMNAFEKQLLEEEERMENAPRRQRARKEIERIQREAEERIKSIRQAVELADREQAARIDNDRKEVMATRAKAVELAERVGQAMENKAPIDVLRALQEIQQEREVDHILSRAHDRLPEAPLERVLPLDAPPSLRATPASRSRYTGPSSYYNSNNSNSGALFPMDGLNESYLPSSGVSPRQLRDPSSSSAAARPPLHGGEDLYHRFMATATPRPRGTRKVDKRPAPASASQTPVPPSGETQPSHSTRPSSRASSRASSTVTSVRKLPKDKDTTDERLAKGWALLRDGKLEEARGVWTAVTKQHDPHTLQGAKARAYIAETLDKDFETAARYYDTCLRLDPQDRMTAYNYGVLLEAVLRQPTRALQLYERAAALGDLVAATRARQLRKIMEEEEGTQPSQDDDDDDDDEEGEGNDSTEEEEEEEEK